MTTYLCGTGLREYFIFLYLLNIIIQISHLVPLFNTTFRDNLCMPLVITINHWNCNPTIFDTNLSPYTVVIYHLRASLPKG